MNTPGPAPAADAVAHLDHLEAESIHIIREVVSVTVTLEDEVDVSRGDVLASAAAPPPVADQFEATIIWMHEEPMLRGRSYLLKIGTQTTPATIAPLKYKMNVNTLEHVAATTLELNEIGVCNLELDNRKARRGELKNFTGIDSPYEAPENAELRLDTNRLTPDQADAVLEYLRGVGLIADET